MKRVVIVGAGVIGLFCAVRLAKAGARVTLVEAEAEHARGPGASAAAAGMLAPMEPEPSIHDELALASFDLWRRWREGAQWADGVRFDGGVVVARDAAGAGSIMHRANRLGRAATQLSPAQFRKRTGLRAMTEHALFVADEAIADGFGGAQAHACAEPSRPRFLLGAAARGRCAGLDHGTEPHRPAREPSSRDRTLSSGGGGVPGRSARPEPFLGGYPADVARLLAADRPDWQWNSRRRRPFAERLVAIPYYS